MEHPYSYHQFPLCEYARTPEDTFKGVEKGGVKRRFECLINR